MSYTAREALAGQIGGLPFEAYINGPMGQVMDCLVLMKGGTMPIFVVEGKLEDDAKVKKVCFIPAKFVDLARDTGRKSSDYKRWGEDIAKNEKVKIEVYKDWTRDLWTRSTSMFWEYNEECYRVELNWWEMLNVPELAHPAVSGWGARVLNFGRQKITIRERTRLGTVEKEFDIRLMSQFRDAYVEDQPVYLMIETMCGDIYEDAVEKLGWKMTARHTDGAKRAQAVLCISKSGVRDALLSLAPVVEKIYATWDARKDEEWEGGFETDKPELGDNLVGAKYIEAEGPAIEKVKGLCGLEAAEWPMKVTINFEKMESCRKKDIRNSCSIDYSWIVTYDDTASYLTFDSKQESLKKAKAFIDVGTSGRSGGRKIADLTKRQRIKAEEIDEELSSTQALEKLVKEAETEEGFREYLLYKIKALEDVMKKLEEGVENDG